MYDKFNMNGMKFIKNDLPQKSDLHEAILYFWTCISQIYITRNYFCHSSDHDSSLKNKTKPGYGSPFNSINIIQTTRQIYMKKTKAAFTCRDPLI